MNRWILQAIVFGFGLSDEANANPLFNPSKVSLSSEASEQSGGINYANIAFQYLAQCSGATLDIDSCLVSNTLSWMSTMMSDSSNSTYDDDHDDDDAVGMRFLQGLNETAGCGSPQMGEEELSFVIGEAETMCADSGISVTMEEKEATLSEFANLFASESCMASLCEEMAQPSEEFFKIFFGEVARCADVDFEIEQCILDFAVSNLLSESDSSAEYDNTRRRLLSRKLACESPSESELNYIVDVYLLSGAADACQTAGVTLENDDLDKAKSSFVAMFAAQHCWGDDGGCDDDLDDGSHDDFVAIDDDDAVVVSKEEYGNEDLFFNVGVKYLSQCSGVTLDMDSCLVSTSFHLLLSQSGIQHQPSNSTDCVAPNFPDDFVLQMMEISRMECTNSGHAVSDDDMAINRPHFLELFGAENCWIEMCEEFIHPSSEQFFQIFFDEVAQCAGVELEASACVLDHVIEELFMSEIGDRRILQMTSMNYDDDDEGSVSCERPSELELHYFVSHMLSGAKDRCAEEGVAVADEELSTVTADIVKMVSAQHCWGNPDYDDCNEHNDDDDFAIDNDDDAVSKEGNSGMNFVNIGFEYINQCSGVNLDLDDCLVSNTFNTLMSFESASRRLQTMNETNGCDEASVPEIEESLLRYMMEMSKQQCTDSGHAISDENYESTLDSLLIFFGSENCWVALCEEMYNPSETFIRILFGEVAKCAQVEFDFSPCILDHVYGQILNPEGIDDGAALVSRARVHRVLETVGVSLDNEINKEVVIAKEVVGDDSHEDDDDYDDNTHNYDDDDGHIAHCEEPDEEMLGFVVSMLLVGADETCSEQGVEVSYDDYENAMNDFVQFFGAQRCWGAEGCNEAQGEPRDEEHHVESEEMISSFADFVQAGALSLLGQCSGEDTSSCLATQSIHLLHLNSTEGICMPPSVDDDDIEQLTVHAKDLCDFAGIHHEENQLNDAKSSLKDLIAQPHCWGDLCSDESRDAVVNGWMHACADVDVHVLQSRDEEENDRIQCIVKEILSQKLNDDVTWECGLPLLGAGACTADLVHESHFLHCGGINVVHPPIPPPQFSLSMSMAYEDEYDWFNDYEPEMCFSYSLEHPYDGFSMDYGHGGGTHENGDEEEDTQKLFEQVCEVIEALNTERSKLCLQPVCELGFENALTFGLETTIPPTISPTVPPTASPTEDTVFPTSMPSSPTLSPSTDSMTGEVDTLEPTAKPTENLTLIPTLKPSPSPSASTSPSARPISATLKPTTSPPTKKPTSSPTKKANGSVEVSFEVAVKLDGINASDLDITSLDSIVNLLEKVFSSMLPEGARVRLLKVGGFAVTRRLLRFLEESSGVDVEFEVTMKQECDDATCTDSEEMSSAIYDDVTTSLKEKVDDGSLSTAIQEEAEAEGVSELSNVTVNKDSFTVSAATVTVQEGTPSEEKTEPPTSSATQRHGLMLSTFGILAAISYLLV